MKRLIGELVEDSTRLIQWSADNQMKANPGKFQAKDVGKHTHNKIFVSILVTILLKIVSEYDQEIPQSQTADDPVAPRGRAAQPSRDTRKTN